MLADKKASIILVSKDFFISLCHFTALGFFLPLSHILFQIDDNCFFRSAIFVALEQDLFGSGFGLIYIWKTASGGNSSSTCAIKTPIK